MLEDYLSMKGKVVLVTGASSGLGMHFANVLAEAGAEVVLGARREEKLQQAVDAICSRGGKAVAVSLDVTDSASITRALDKAESAFGHVNVLINNAGVNIAEKFINIDENSWDSIVDTNLKGSWQMASAVCKRLIDVGADGSIVNISSILGLRAGFGECAYSVSKAGVIQMTKSMALELGHKGIRVNAICPGYFKTEMNSDYFETKQGLDYIKSTPARRLGSMDELNVPLLMLSSDSGSFINGVALPVDGGHLVSSL